MLAPERWAAEPMTAQLNVSRSAWMTTAECTMQRGRRKVALASSPPILPAMRLACFCAVSKLTDFILRKAMLACLLLLLALVAAVAAKKPTPPPPPTPPAPSPVPPAPPGSKFPPYICFQLPENWCNTFNLTLDKFDSVGNAYYYGASPSCS